MKQEIPPKSSQEEEVREILKGIKNSKNEDTIQVPLMITKDMHRQLADLGYSKDDRKNMNPEKANDLIINQITKKTTDDKEKPNEKEVKQTEIKKDIEAGHDKKNEEENKKVLEKQLTHAGLKEDDFKNIQEWSELSVGQKMLVVEQAAQDTLLHVKEIGEQRFQEKNKLSWNPKTWYKNLTKSVWISKEEKNTIEDIKNGKIKTNEEKLKQLTERAVDMNLNTTIKDGKASIEFIPMDKSLSKEQQEVVENYNKLANEFSKLPDSWKNERASASKKSNLLNKNKSEYYNKYKNLETQYKDAKDKLLKIRTEQYGEEKAMLEMKDKDFEIAMLQFTNTNPDAIEELKRIENEASWGRLVSNENLWRVGYGAIGFGARKGLTYGLGLLAAPIVAGTIGGIRAREKAKQKINTAFMEGRNEETSRERKENGTVGKINNKNAKTGIMSKVFSGQKVNTKEVAAFVEADSQILRLDNWMKRLNKATSDKERLTLSDELSTRIDFIEQKHREGLINYGTKNAVGLNYELFKKLSEASVELKGVKFLMGVEDINTIIEENNKRDELLEKIMALNEAKLGHKQAVIKNQEMLRGMAVSASFSVLGFYIRDLYHLAHGTPSIDAHTHADYSETENHTMKTHLENGHLIKNIDTTKTNKPLDEAVMKKYFPNTKIENTENIVNKDAIVHKGEGIENTFIRQIENNHELAKSLGFKGNINDANALKDFAGREAHILAIKEGYVGTNGQEIRVVGADKVAYEIKIENGHAVVNEKTVGGKVIETHHEGDKFSVKHNEYESIHNKNSVAEHTNNQKQEIKQPIKNDESKIGRDNEVLEKIKDKPVQEIQSTNTLEVDKNILNKDEIISKFKNASDQIKNTYAEDLMKVTNEPIEQNEVGRQLIELRDTIHTETGKLINPTPNESFDHYLNNLMKEIPNHQPTTADIHHLELDKNIGIKHSANEINNERNVSVKTDTTQSEIPKWRTNWLSIKSKELDEFIKKDNPFKGETFVSDNNHYREVGFGQSKDLETARRMATEDFRAKIAAESGISDLGLSNKMEFHDLKEVTMKDNVTGEYRIYYAGEVDKHIENAKSILLNENQLINFHKAFPSNELINGIPRAEYDNKVLEYLQKTNIKWEDQAHKDADLWLWEKFGKVDPMQSPDENPLWQLAKNSKDPSAMDLMEVGKEEENKYKVGHELVKLFNLVKKQTGEEVYPNISPVETPNKYIYRLMNKLENNNS